MLGVEDYAYIKSREDSSEQGDAMVICGPHAPKPGFLVGRKPLGLTLSIALVPCLQDIIYCEIGETFVDIQVFPTT
jgi:hypothetical protein